MDARSQLAITRSKLTIGTLEQAVKYVQSSRRQCRRSGVFIVNFEHISHLVLVSVVNFEQVNAGWDCDLLL